MSTVLLVYDPPYLSIQKPILFALRIQYTIFLLEVELSPPLSLLSTVQNLLHRRRTFFLPFFFLLNPSCIFFPGLNSLPPPLRGGERIYSPANIGLHFKHFSFKTFYLFRVPFQDPLYRSIRE